MMLVVTGLTLSGLVIGSTAGEDSDPMQMGGMVIGIALNIALVALFLFANLKTEMTTAGISVRFFPFHLSAKHFSWDEISKAEVRRYDPLSEYGGWGIKGAFFSNGKAYNVSGNMGLQLEFNDGKRLLIGTQKPDEIQAKLLDMQKG